MTVILSHQTLDLMYFVFQFVYDDLPVHNAQNSIRK